MDDNQSKLTKAIEIYIRVPSGLNFSLYPQPDDMVDSLQDKIFDKSGVPKDQQRLIFAGKELKAFKTLSEYNIGKETRIDVLIRLREK